MAARGKAIRQPFLLLILTGDSIYNTDNKRGTAR